MVGPVVEGQVLEEPNRYEEQHAEPDQGIEPILGEPERREVFHSILVLTSFFKSSRPRNGCRAPSLSLGVKHFSFSFAKEKEKGSAEVA